MKKIRESFHRIAAAVFCLIMSMKAGLFPGNFTVKFLWENPCGYLQKGSMHNIVTSGSGVWGPAMRVGTDSEICTINLIFSNS